MNLVRYVKAGMGQVLMNCFNRPITTCQKEEEELRRKQNILIENSDVPAERHFINNRIDAAIKEMEEQIEVYARTKK
jgi:hypothetical protein